MAWMVGRIDEWAETGREDEQGDEVTKEGQGERSGWRDRWKNGRKQGRRKEQGDEETKEVRDGRRSGRWIEENRDVVRNRWMKKLKKEKMKEADDGIDR